MRRLRSKEARRGSEALIILLETLGTALAPKSAQPEPLARSQAPGSASPGAHAAATRTPRPASPPADAATLAHTVPPIVPDAEKIRSFPTEAAFEAWLAEHHATETELWLRLYKKHSGVPTVTNPQAIDVALCWGWIDGIRKAFDHASFLQRFTPRKPKSVWSQINRDNVERLIAAGRMTPHGHRLVQEAKADGRWDAAYAPMRNTTVDSLPSDLRAAIEANPRAAATLRTLGRANLFALGFRTSNMKTAAGRARKITTLVDMLARGETIVPEATARKTKASGASADRTPREAPPASAKPRATRSKKP